MHDEQESHKATEATSGLNGGLGVMVGSLIFRKQIELKGAIARETVRRGILKAWHNKEEGEPVIEYPDGTMEVLRREEWR